MKNDEIDIIILNFESIYNKKCKEEGLKQSEWSESEFFSINEVIRILNKLKENKTK